MTKKIFKIEGMHCASCARNIENSVKKLKDIKSCSVNFATKKLYVEGETNEEEIKKAVSKIGDYKAIYENGENAENKNNEKSEEEDVKESKENKTTTFIIPRLDNPHCAMTIENALKKVNGIKNMELNINMHKAKIIYSGEKIKVREAIIDAGYEIAGEEKVEEDIDLIEMQKAKKRMWIAWLFAIPIAIIGILFERILGIENFIIKILP